MPKPQAFFVPNFKNSPPDALDQPSLSVLVKEHLPENLAWPSKALFSSNSWEYWLDGSGQQSFYAVDPKPGCMLQVDAGFRHGYVFTEFLSEGDAIFQPLWSLEIRLFSAWLASLGDLILHASGVKLEGRGYAFLGESGAGKSTLIHAFANRGQGLVLGEDQIILRLIEGRFWIFGTPWHEDPQYCSPEGVPLQGLYFLNHDEEPGITLLSPLEGVSAILQTAFVPYYRADWVAGILQNLDLLARRVPFYRLSYQLGTDPGEYLA